MAQTVLLPQDVAAAGKDFLTERGYRVVVASASDRETLLEEGRGAQAVLLRTAPCDAALIAGLPDVKIIARHGVGVDNIDLAAASAAGKWVTNTPWANASSVAETTIALLLAIAKDLKNDIEHQASGDFAYKYSHHGLDLEGKTLGIIGYGKIGRAVAAKLAGFGMQILIADPFVTAAEAGKVVSRDQLLAQADFVTLHLPALPSTIGSFDAASLAKMKPSAYLLNLSRGSIVDEPALIDALQRGVIAGAALDVYSQEPLPLDNPLQRMANVILTPHIASNTTETMDRMALQAAQEIDRVLRGERPSWPVNRPQGLELEDN
ncbi:hydroxyacid dehydrogenase [Lacticaseibacillus suihuaensis]